RQTKNVDVAQAVVYRSPARTATGHLKNARAESPAIDCARIGGWVDRNALYRGINQTAVYSGPACPASEHLGNSASNGASVNFAWTGGSMDRERPDVGAG